MRSVFIFLLISLQWKKDSSNSGTGFGYYLGLSLRRKRPDSFLFIIKNIIIFWHRRWSFLKKNSNSSFVNSERKVKILTMPEIFIKILISFWSKWTVSSTKRSVFTKLYSVSLHSTRTLPSTQPPRPRIIPQKANWILGRTHSHILSRVYSD